MPPQYSKLDNLNLITLNSISEHFCIIFGPTRHENHRFAPVLYFMVVCESSLAQLRKLCGIFQSLIVSSFFFTEIFLFFLSSSPTTILQIKYAPSSLRSRIRLSLCWLPPYSMNINTVKSLPTYIFLSKRWRVVEGDLRIPFRQFQKYCSATDT